MSGKLVAFFSASGVTADVADALAKEAGATLYEIEPAEPYTDADLDWRDQNSRSTLEMRDEKSRPALAIDPSIARDNDVIYIGFPIWWGVEPRVIDTFLDGIGTAGKTLIPFATSGGSGISGAEGHLKALYPYATILPGRLLNRAGVADLRDFVEKTESAI